MRGCAVLVCCLLGVCLFECWKTTIFYGKRDFIFYHIIHI
nr:MAG TPA: hypothetical protein [Caudoviricetes sp.]